MVLIDDARERDFLKGSLESYVKKKKNWLWAASDHTRAMCMLRWITYLSLMTSVTKRVSMYIWVIYASSKKFFCSRENIPLELWYRLCWLSWKCKAASWLLEHIVKLKLSTTKKKNQGTILLLNQLTSKSNAIVDRNETSPLAEANHHLPLLSEEVRSAQEMYSSCSPRRSLRSSDVQTRTGIICCEEKIRDKERQPIASPILLS